MRKHGLCSVIALSLSACAPQTYTSEQVTTQQYLYKTVTLDKTLDEVEKAHAEAFARCNDGESLIRRKVRFNRAFLMARATGFLVPESTLAVVEFEEVNGRVTLDAYTAYPGWRDYLDVIIAQIQGEQRCIRN